MPIGLKSFSIPSVNSIGDVVNVSIDVPIINRINLIAINAAVFTPSTYIDKNPILYSNVSGVPLIIKIFSTAVNTTNKNIGFNPLTMNLNGIFATKITANRNPITTVYPINLFTINKHIINIRDINIFVLGSNL